MAPVLIIYLDRNLRAESRNTGGKWTGRRARCHAVMSAVGGELDAYAKIG